MGQHIGKEEPGGWGGLAHVASSTTAHPHGTRPAADDDEVVVIFWLGYWRHVARC